MSRVSKQRRALAEHRGRLARDAHMFEEWAASIRSIDGPLTWDDQRRARTFEAEAELCRSVLNGSAS